MVNVGQGGLGMNKDQVNGPNSSDMPCTDDSLQMSWQPYFPNVSVVFPEISLNCPRNLNYFHLGDTENVKLLWIFSENGLYGTTCSQSLRFSNNTLTLMLSLKTVSSLLLAMDTFLL